MKKNRMMRLVSVLLICVLLTTSIISGTFAKYTTEGSVTDTARVAKWGIKIDVTSGLFATAYNSPDTTTPTVTVSSSDNSNLVAPGTSGIGLNVKDAVTGTPEVSYSVTIKLDDTSAKMPKLNYTPKNESVTDYEPAKFSVYNGETELKSGMSLNELTEPFNNGLIVYKHNVRNKQYTVNANLNSNFETSKTHSSNKPDIKIK